MKSWCAICVMVAVALASFIIVGCSDMGDEPVPPKDTTTLPGQIDVSVADSSAIEGGNIVFRVSRVGYANIAVTVAYATANGLAMTGFDFTSDTGAVTIDSGQAFALIVVPTIGDTSLESGESFTLTISEPSLDSVTITDAVAVGQIWDDDGVSFSADIRPLLVRDCAIIHCHGSGWQQGDVTFGGALWSDVRNSTNGVTGLVVPMDASGSLLYDVVASGLMPNGLTPWTAEEKKLLEDWINQDAQDN